MTLKFDKYHGIGNDFLVVEVDRATDVSIERAKRLCDRHFGVGADGVLLVSPPRSDQARAEMTVINSDGSIPEMCGNGLRCVALHVARRSGEAQAEFVIDTGAGPLLCTVTDDSQGSVVGTEIGRGRSVGTVKSPIHNEMHVFYRMNTGNPHAICFRAPISREQLDVVGPELQKLVAGGVNVEIASLISTTEIELAVWERGVGQTLACGTGAAATVIEAVRQGKCPPNQAITVHLPGGPLQITVNLELDAYLRGPAQWVYAGTTEL